MSEHRHEWAVVEYISLDVPCPFCGCDSGELLQFGDEECWETECAKCWARVRGDSRQEAIAAWNMRAERTCHNTSIEFRCSECGAVCDGFDGYYNSTILPSGFSYCPNCGAKVVSD